MFKSEGDENGNDGIAKTVIKLFEAFAFSPREKQVTRASDKHKSSFNFPIVECESEKNVHFRNENFFLIARI